MGEIGFDQFYMLVCILLAREASNRAGPEAEEAGLGCCPHLAKGSTELRVHPHFPSFHSKQEEKNGGGGDTFGS